MRMITPSVPHLIALLRLALIGTAPLALLAACVSAAPLPAQFDPPAKGQAQLVVYRHGGPLRTGVIRPALHIGDADYGPVYPTSWRPITLPPGRYPVWAGADDSRGADVNLAAGETRYVRVIVELDYEARGAEVVEVDEPTAAAALENLLRLD